MRTTYTSRLFYNKYPYKIVFVRNATIGDPDYHLGWTIHNCKCWLDINNIDHRMYNRIQYLGRHDHPKTKVVVTGIVFLSSKKSFDKVIRKWKSVVDSVVIPYDQSHIDVLKNNTKILIRSTYLYNRFKYVVTFTRAWEESIDDLSEWIENSFLDRDQADGEIKYAKNGWNPRIYLTSEADLVLTKLTWGERIKEITVVCTIDELESSKNPKP